MRYRTRLVLLVTGLLASAVIIISALLAWNTRNALLDLGRGPQVRWSPISSRAAPASPTRSRTRSRRCSAPRWWLKRGSSRISSTPRRRQASSPEEINRRLRQLADTTVLDEFWITDEKGHAYLRNIDVDFTFSPSALEQPQAYAFWPLLSGKKDQVIQEARRREIDDQHFKYAGVGRRR